jgi:hypothetical protein
MTFNLINGPVLSAVDFKSSRKGTAFKELGNNMKMFSLD